MTVDERKMAIAYADLLNIRELVRHILCMNADDLFNSKAKKAFAQIALQLDMVMSDVGSYVSSNTDFGKETSDGRIESEP